MAASPSTIESASPPWPLIHFDVRCARCGHDLRGQSQPVCPACHLEFSWSQAAPLDQLTCAKCDYHLYGLSDSRCPECGTPIGWNEALLRYRRREKPLFEYRWRDRSVRSFFHTWLLTLRPFRIWRQIDLHDQPALGPLVIWAIIVVTLVSLFTPIAFGLTLWCRDYLLQSPAGLTVVSLSNIPQYLLMLFRFGVGYVLIATIVLYSFFTLASLLVFQQSMARCKVRTVHVIRVVSYSAVGLLPLYALFYLLFVFGVMNAWYWSSFVQRLQQSAWGLLLVPFLHLFAFVSIVTMTLTVAYHRYLRMPHSIWIAASSQAIAVMAVAAFFSLLNRIFGN